jgi:hypothetical protein
MTVDNELEEMGLTPEEEAILRDGPKEGDDEPTPDDEPKDDEPTPDDEPAPEEDPKPDDEPKPDEDTPPADKEAEIAENLKKALRESRDEIRELREQGKTRDEKMEEILTAIKKKSLPDKPEEVAEKVPEYGEDPLGYLHGNQANIEKLAKETGKEIEQVRAELEQEREFKRVATITQSKENAFKQTHTDYNDAFTHLLKVTEADLQDSGMKEAEIPQNIANMIYAFSKSAVDAGKDPAAMLYDRAKRYGYVQKEAVADPTEGKTDVDEHMDTVQKGIEASKTVKGSQSVETEPTAEKIMEMMDSDDPKVQAEAEKMFRKFLGA